MDLKKLVDELNHMTKEERDDVMEDAEEIVEKEDLLRKVRVVNKRDRLIE
jgi:hypothetical protein